MCIRDRDSSTAIREIIDKGKEEVKVELKWETDVKGEGVNSVKVVDIEPYFLIVTCLNGMAYLINAVTGERIDSVRQGMNYVPEPIGYRLKEKYKAISAEAKKQALVNIKETNTLFKLKAVPFIDEESEEKKLLGRSSKWGLMMDVEKIKHEIAQSDEAKVTNEIPLSPREILGKINLLLDAIKQTPEKEEDAGKKIKASKTFMKRKEWKTQRSHNELIFARKETTTDAYKKLKPKKALKGKAKQADDKIYTLFKEYENTEIE
eukprot:TRINITY_DN18329_c0_g1_i2.p1 TRINITY_DN18329_c0_g1~~TRINITY_DN18329_c0_g1_i2.p1  ORF type:complete len:263 (+),score=63.13 TRINITY_DN18329_c0_g1_i2:62-850(+)